VGDEAGSAVVDAGGQVHHLVRRVAHLRRVGGGTDGPRLLGFRGATEGEERWGVIFPKVTNLCSKYFRAHAHKFCRFDPDPTIVSVFFTYPLPPPLPLLTDAASSANIRPRPCRRRR
jgi:hypothetical protein